jgi:hypothetical protein
LRIKGILRIKDNVKATMRNVVIVLTVASWIAISNHCTFATLAPKTNAVEAACPFHSKPDKQRQHNAQAQCCKILRALPFAQSKAWARDDTIFSDVTLPVTQYALTEHLACAVAPLLLDTGPPGAYSFAELILQRSLLAHAPPIVD